MKMEILDTAFQIGVERVKSVENICFKIIASS